MKKSRNDYLQQKQKKTCATIIGTPGKVQYATDASFSQVDCVCP